MTYDRVNWQNEPSENTPLSAENLNKMDSAIKTLSEMVVANPVEADTDELKKIGIEGTIYKIAGGHELVNSSGSTMTQRSKMAFLDTHLTDDSGNNTTKVQVTKEITTAQFLSETEEGLYFFTDMPDSVVTAEQVAYDSNNSVKDKMNGLVYTGNLDDLETTGVYEHTVTANSNAPSSVSVGALLNIFVLANNNIYTQTAYYGNICLFVRRKFGGTWSDWARLDSLKSDIVSGTTNGDGAFVSSISNKRIVVSAVKRRDTDNSDFASVALAKTSDNASWIFHLFNNQGQVYANKSDVKIQYYYLEM